MCFSANPFIYCKGFGDYTYKVQNYKYNYHQFTTYKIRVTKFCRPTSMHGINEICTVKPTENESAAQHKK
jgi:hypothetical protein